MHSEEDVMRYRVSRLDQPPVIDANWDKASWSSAQTGTISDWAGPRPGHLPITSFKVAYDDDALYVIFCVQDRYIRAVEGNYQGPVCKDSCVEFFFAPNDDVQSGYFNLELNCSGTALFMFQKARGIEEVRIPRSVFDRLTIAHSIPDLVNPEITEPTTWTVEYRLPMDVLEEYAKLTRPLQGTSWRANFYKCGDDTSHPHWLAWSKVNSSTPDFHRPECFGRLEF